MAISVTEKELWNILSKRMLDLNFIQESLLWYTRLTPMGCEMIRLGSRRSRNQVFISGTAGICFLAVQQLLKPESKGATSPTILVPFHFLHENRRFFEWSIDTSDSTDSVSLLAECIFSEVKSHILPFFHNYQELTRVKTDLESSNPENWFTLTPEQRVATLAAIECVTGNAEAAMAILDQALADRVGAPPKTRRLIEGARTRVARYHSI